MTRGQETDEEKMEKAGERGGEKRKRDAPQGSDPVECDERETGVEEAC